MNEFNRDAENLRYYFWITAISLNLVGWFVVGAIAFGFLIPLCIGLLLLRPWQYTISKVSIVNQQLEVTKCNWLLGSKSYKFDLSRIDFTYRTRPIRLVKNGMLNLSNTGNVLMVFMNERFLFDLTPDDSGWTNASIRQLANKLRTHCVKQMLEKYGTSDVLEY